MKVKTTKILCGVLAMLAFTACSSNIDDADGNHPQFWHVTLQASMGDEITRALSEGTGNAIIASFAENDEVVVVDADGSTIVGTLKAQSAGASTTLTGTLDAKSLVEGEVVTLRYRCATANYDSQAGTVAGIAASQDYEEGTLTVSSVEPLTFTSNSVTLRAKQSITKFTFTDGANPANAISVKNFRIIATGLVQSIATNGAETVGTVTGTLEDASSNVYVALRNNTDAKQTYTFIVKDNSGNWHVGTKNAKLTNGKNYTATVALNSTLNSGSAEGTIGIVGGLPAIVVDFSGTKKAVALMNVGATWPEDYGTYYTYEKMASGLSNDWYVPTKEELESLKDTYTSTWGTLNSINGCTFTIGGNTLFFPAAGYYINGFISVSSEGYYWSSTNYDETLAYALNLDNDPTFIIQFISWYKVDALTVRPFHALN